MYLTDHRGTGRSTRLPVRGRQSSILLFGEVMSKHQALEKCAKELISKYGDMASFSTTSSSKDVATFMGEHTNGEDTIVYGGSYGTMLGERLIHLDPPEVTGYVLDGIASSSGARASEIPYYSNWDTDFGEADQFLVMSQEDKEIAARFKKRGLAGALS